MVVAAKSPQAGFVKTRLVQEGDLTLEQAAALASAFLADTLATVQSAAEALRADAVLALDGSPALVTGLDRVTTSRISLTQQQGNSLGERLVHIFEAGFGREYGRVIVVGSDAPHLPASFLIEAAGRLDVGKAGSVPVNVVLGPSEDGGYYLIGLSRQSQPALFRDIPWSSSETRATTLQRAEEAGLTLGVLPPWYDIDTMADLRRLARDVRRGVVLAPATTALLMTEAFERALLAKAGR